jgi:Protein of unknown function (DUF3140)
MAQKVNPIDPDTDEADEVRREFDDNVNMTAAELEKWLDTDESKRVGQKDGGESARLRPQDRQDPQHQAGRIEAGRPRSHEEGQRLRVAASEAAPGQAEGPAQDTAWAHSLKNWGHDPLK